MRGGSVQAWSASCLVVGAMALGLAGALSPIPTGGSAGPVLQMSIGEGERCEAMAAALFLGSVSLLLGLPTILSVFTDRGRGMGRLAVGVYAIGVLGSAGYAMLLVFLRALAERDAMRPGMLPVVVDDPALGVTLVAWVGAFYVGLVLMAIALLRARRTGVWIPVLLLTVVACLPFVSMAGHVGQVLQVLLFAVAMSGIAIAAVRGSNIADIR